YHYFAGLGRRPAPGGHGAVGCAALAGSAGTGRRSDSLSPARRRRRRDLSRCLCPEGGAHMSSVGAFVILFPVLLVLLLIPILIGVYVYRDAKRRQMNAVVWTLVAILAPTFIGFIIYLLVRSNYADLACPRCGTPVAPEFVVCPQCGTLDRKSVV